MAVGADSEYFRACEPAARGTGASHQFCERQVRQPSWRRKAGGAEWKTLLVYVQVMILWCTGKWAAAEAAIPRKEDRL